MKPITFMITFILAAMLLLTACADPNRDTQLSPQNVLTTSSQMESMPVESTPEEFQNPGGQGMAIDAYSSIMQNICPIPSEDPGDPVYPEEFGDAYIEDNFLYICLTDTSSEMQEKYRAMVTEPRILKFVQVEHSYNDLCALQYAISRLEGLKFSFIGVDVVENEVDMGIPDISKKEETMALITENLPAEVTEQFFRLPVAIEEANYITFD